MTATRAAIVFNSSTGSDTAASGLGPSTAVSGTAAAHTNGSASTTITLTNSPDLSGVQAGDLLWLKTASGRQFSVIASVNDGADTVTVDDSFNIASGSAVNYAIGGKRATWDNADSRQLFADAFSAWIIETETNQTLSSVITFGASVPSGGWLGVRGSSGSLKTINTTANDNHFLAAVVARQFKFQNLKFTSTNATKQPVFNIVNTSGTCRYFLLNCWLGDPTDKVASFATRAGAAPSLVAKFVNCTFEYLTGAFWPTTGNVIQFEFHNCVVRHGASSGIDAGGGNNNRLVCRNTIIHNCAGQGINYAATSSPEPFIVTGCIIHNNGMSGVLVAGGSFDVTITENIITDNGSYGINASGGGGRVGFSHIDRNAFRGNTSGPVNGMSAGPNDVTLSADPYEDAASGDFNLNDTAGGGAALRAVEVTMP